MGREMEEKFKTEEMYVYLWLIHVEVGQKRIKFCKAIILQLKNKLKKIISKRAKSLINLVIKKREKEMIPKLGMRKNTKGNQKTTNIYKYLLCALPCSRS